MADPEASAGFLRLTSPRNLGLGALRFRQAPRTQRRLDRARKRPQGASSPPCGRFFNDLLGRIERLILSSDAIRCRCCSLRLRRRANRHHRHHRRRHSCAERYHRHRHRLLHHQRSGWERGPKAVGPPLRHHRRVRAGARELARVGLRLRSRAGVRVCTGPRCPQALPQADWKGESRRSSGIRGSARAPASWFPNTPAAALGDRPAAADS